MKGYKVFKSDWTCRRFQYKVGETFDYDGAIELRESGFHFCPRLTSCFSYYPFDPFNKVAEVEALGTVHLCGGLAVTDKLHIIREIAWHDVLDMCNTGSCNTGSGNIGNFNSGHFNIGNHNAGNYNKGDYNVGNYNKLANYNVGSNNVGSFNVGNNNIGSHNVGFLNVGSWNTGDYNTGDWNTGFFNTDTPTVRMFNKDTGLTPADIAIPHFLQFTLSKWTTPDDATDEERCECRNEIERFNKFIRLMSYKDAFRYAWDNASEAERKQVERLPNFDADIFYEISGIRV